MKKKNKVIFEKWLITRARGAKMGYDEFGDPMYYDVALRYILQYEYINKMYCDSKSMRKILRGSKQVVKSNPDEAIKKFLATIKNNKGVKLIPYGESILVRFDIGCGLCEDYEFDIKFRNNEYHIALQIRNVHGRRNWDYYDTLEIFRDKYGIDLFELLDINIRDKYSEQEIKVFEKYGLDINIRRKTNERI